MVRLRLVLCCWACTLHHGDFAFAKEENQFCVNPDQQEHRRGGKEISQHRTNSRFKELCGLHLQGDLTHTNTYTHVHTRTKRHLLATRKALPGFPTTAPPPTSGPPNARFCLRGGGTSLAGARAKGKCVSRTRSLVIPSISNRMQTEGKWQICESPGWKLKTAF